MPKQSHQQSIARRLATASGLSYSECLKLVRSSAKQGTLPERLDAAGIHEASVAIYWSLIRSKRPLRAWSENVSIPALEAQGVLDADAAASIHAALANNQSIFISGQCNSMKSVLALACARAPLPEDGGVLCRTDAGEDWCRTLLQGAERLVIDDRPVRLVLDEITDPDIAARTVKLARLRSQKTCIVATMHADSAEAGLARLAFFTSLAQPSLSETSDTLRTLFPVAVSVTHPSIENIPSCMVGTAR